MYCLWIRGIGNKNSEATSGYLSVHTWLPLGSKDAPKGMLALSGRLISYSSVKQLGQHISLR